MYDQNGDKIVTYSEYYQGVTRDNYFSLWDMNKDQFISETELAETVFKNWDSNNDSSMSRSEYTYFDSFFSDI
ncbi:MAG: hypothetical protein MRY83_04740, partial [Flavobacteriales bacterium]|nr:hypothetical protein [Flavobacteriales bacterium]